MVEAAHDGGRVGGVPFDEVLEEIAYNRALRDFLGVGWVQDLLRGQWVGQVVRNGTEVCGDVEVDGIFGTVRLKDDVEIDVVLWRGLHKGVKACLSNNPDGDNLRVGCSGALGVEWIGVGAALRVGKDLADWEESNFRNCTDGSQDALFVAVSFESDQIAALWVHRKHREDH